MLADILGGIAKQERPASPSRYYARPSFAGPERCLRQLVYMAHGVDGASRPGRATLTLDDSSWHEELTADWTAKSLYQVHSRQMPVEIPAPGLNPYSVQCESCSTIRGTATPIPPGVLHGHLDWIVTDPLGRDTIVEHKAINRYGFDRCLKGMVPLDYITQGCLYLRGARRLQPQITGVLILIKCKDTARYLEYQVAYDDASDTATVERMVQSHGDAPAIETLIGMVLPAITGTAIARLLSVQAYQHDGTLPARPYELGTDFPCGYCPFEGPCWEGYAREFAALADEQALDAEVADLARYYLETSAHVSEVEKEREALRTKIRGLLEAQGVKGGTAGEYLVLRAVRERTVWDEEKIPAPIAAVAKQKKPYEVLQIRRRKE